MKTLCTFILLSVSFGAFSQRLDPLRGLNVPFSVYRVNLAECQIIIHSSGTRIVIPLGAVVNRKGVAVREFDLYYREFRNTLDMIGSGISMSFVQNGNMSNLESSGMFEIRAKLNGEDLIIDPTIGIEVKYADSPALKGQSFFSFREDAQTWENIPNPIDVDSDTDKDWGLPLEKSGRPVDSLKAAQVSNLIFQSSVIQSFGLHNYDKIIGEEVRSFASAKFLLNGEAISTTLHVIHSRLNTNLSFYPTDFDQFFFYKRNDVTVFTITPWASLAYAKNIDRGIFSSNLVVNLKEIKLEGKNLKQVLEETIK